MVYVQNLQGNPLMPCTEAKARKLLKNKRAKVKRIEPFTIQLCFECENITQEITLGIDAGSKRMGLSATTKEKELYASNVELRNDIIALLSTRRENRRTRRNRLRYRKARFKNRTYTKKKGWLAPSVKNKIDTHLRVIADVYKILPITKIVVEVASFDIQKIKHPQINGTEYQEGEQWNFWNVREYVLFRDNHICQHCYGKSKDVILNVHHLESRKIGGNAPNNLLTLCETCHKKYHKGEIQLKQKRGNSFKDATFMGIMRWNLYQQLKERYFNVSITYGYLTKNKRMQYHLPKEHFIDARCISGNPLAEPLGYYFYQKKVRCHNRKIHKANLLKGGRKKRNQASYLVKGFRLFDKVKYQGQLYYIFGRRATGYFDIRRLDGEKVKKGSVSYKYLQLIETRKSMLIERREALFS